MSMYEDYGTNRGAIDAVRLLEDDFADAMTRMYSVGNDLARLRAQMTRDDTAAHPEPSTAQAPVAQPLTNPPPQATPSAAASSHGAPGVMMAAPGSGLILPPPVAAPPFAQPRAATAPSTPWWQREGIVARLLAVVGAGITLIGVTLLLALAIQLGFFGPLARVLTGAALAIGLLGAAFVVRRRQRSPIGAIGLAATGIATAYLDVVAATAIYDWVPIAAGLVTAGLLALGGLLLARSWDSESLAVIAVIGAALCVPTVGFGHLVLIGAFLLMLSVASWPAQISRSWPVLELVRVVPTAIYLTALPFSAESPLVTSLLAVGMTVSTLVSTLAGQRLLLAPAQLGVLVPVASLPMLGAGIALHDQWLSATMLTALTCLLILLAGLSSESTETPLEHRVVMLSLSTAALTSLTAAGYASGPVDWILPALLIIAIAWTAAAIALQHRAVLYCALGTGAIALLPTATLLPFVVLRRTADDAAVSHLIAALAALVLLVLAHLATRAIPVAPRVLIAGAMLYAGAAVIMAGSLLGQTVDAAAGGFTAGQASATLLWLVTAAWLLLRGLRGSTVAVPAGLALAALSVGKLLLFDLAFLDGIARVVSFIVGGLLLLAMGAGYAQALERTRRQPQ